MQYIGTWFSLLFDDLIAWPFLSLYILNFLDFFYKAVTLLIAQRMTRYRITIEYKVL